MLPATVKAIAWVCRNASVTTFTVTVRHSSSAGVNGPVSLVRHRSRKGPAAVLVAKVGICVPPRCTPTRHPLVRSVVT